MLSRSTREIPVLITTSSPPTELEARLRLTLKASYGIAKSAAKGKIFTA